MDFYKANGHFITLLIILIVIVQLISKNSHFINIILSDGGYALFFYLEKYRITLVTYL